MGKASLNSLPHMLYADEKGRIYDHPRFRMTGFSGARASSLNEEDLIRMPDFSKLFFIPDCPPVGLDPVTGRRSAVHTVRAGGVHTKCYAVAAFLPPGVVRSHLPGVDYRGKSYTLPTWSYTAVGYREGEYWTTGFEIEYNPRWDPHHYDDLELVPAIERFQKENRWAGPLIDHLTNCAAVNHCFAAKNLFLGRWEAPIPVSRRCNADCLGCLSLQGDASCEASHQRISFTPSKEEIVRLAVHHLENAPEAIVSFGQGCEGEPLTEHELISRSILEIRKRTTRGTVNLNTNGSRPERIALIAESGLDSIRISLNSARAEFYTPYYRPKGYQFYDVVASIALSREMGLFTMINYLVFPGITDQEGEIEALLELIRKTKVNFIHLKNLNIDPQFYLEKMPKNTSPPLGMRKVVDLLKSEFPELQLGYFNQAVR
jgi:pyruvate-formate lyase-activating enzyme